MKKTESAGGIILNKNGEVALVKNGPSFWGFPKGHVDPGENAEQAARREIQEESGLKELRLIRQLDTYERYRGALDGGDELSELKTIHMFLFETDETELKPEDVGNPEARWVPLDSVEALLTSNKDKEYFARERPLVTR